MEQKAFDKRKNKRLMRRTNKRVFIKLDNAIEELINDKEFMDKVNDELFWCDDINEYIRNAFNISKEEVNMLNSDFQRT
jgi:hypothetical protein